MVSCVDCSSDPADSDTPEFSRHELRTARKEHTCYECGHHIHAGEQYEYAVGKWDGFFNEAKACSICLEIRAWFCPNGSEYGGLDEALQDGAGVSLAIMRGVWKRLKAKDAIIAGLVDLVSELMEAKR